MPLYNYDAFIDGIPLKGSMRGSSAEEVTSSLRKKGLLISNLTQINADNCSPWNPGQGSMALYLRELATFIRAGHQITDALEAMLESRSGSEAAMTATLLDLIEGGLTLSQALERNSPFHGFIIQSIKAGEMAGNPGRSMDSCASILESRETLNRKLLSAASYPLFICLVAMSSAVYLTARVIPTLSSIYESTGVALPPLTRFLVSVASADWKFWFLFISASALLITYLLKLSRGQWSESVEKAIRRIPGLGKLVTHSRLSAALRTMAFLTDANVPLIEALRVSAATAESHWLREAFTSTARRVEGGTGFVDALRASGAVPAEITGILRAGEKSRRISEMLFRTSDLMDEQINGLTTAFSNLLEPVMVLGAGAIVGTVVAGIILPLFQANSLLGN